MKRFVFLLILAASAGTAVFAQLDLQPAAIVRLTRSEPITVRQLRTQSEMLAWQNLAPSLGRIPTNAELSRAVQSFSLEQRRQILDVMINERLALQAAERDRVTVTDNELNLQINQIRDQMAMAAGRQPTEEEFAVAIKNETGMDFPAFREQIRRQSITQKYLMQAKEPLFRGVTPPSEAEILREFNINRTEFIRPETVRFHMIQVPYGQDAASRARARTLAEGLSREINSDPAKFDEVALRSQSPNSGFQAGDGGYLPMNSQARQMAGSEFMDVAFSLRQGQVSRLIEGVSGYQIIKVTENHAMRNLGLDDIVQPGSNVTVRQFISQTLLQQRHQAVQARATQELITELREGNPFQVMEQNLSNW